MTEWTAFRVQDRGPVAEVTLLGPGKHNALGPDFWRELPQVFAALDASPAVRAIVLTGSGANFSTGLDVAAMRHHFTPVLRDPGLTEPRAAFHLWIRQMQAAVTAVAECRKPVVAAVQGVCIGGAMDLISSADIRYASADATFSIREVRLAIVADTGSLHRLPAVIGDGHLRELAYTGKFIDADRALQIGLVNAVLPDPAAARETARATAAEIADNPPPAVQGIKEILSHARAAAIDSELRYVAAWNSAFGPSPELIEAFDTATGPRAPRSTGP
jgi:enoyl-CoA hydratase